MKRKLSVSYKQNHYEYVLLCVLLIMGISFQLVSCASAPKVVSGKTMITCKPQMKVHSFPLIGVDGVSGKTVVANYLEKTPFMYNDINGKFNIELLPGEHILTFALGKNKDPYDVKIILGEGIVYSFSADKDSVRIIPEVLFTIEKSMTYAEPNDGASCAVLKNTIKDGKAFIYKIDNKWVLSNNEVKIPTGDHEIQSCVLVKGRYYPEPVIIKKSFLSDKNYRFEYIIDSNNSIEFNIREE